MRIAALCNSLMGIPSLKLLAKSGALTGMGIPGIAHEATVWLRELAPQLEVPLTVFSQPSFAGASEAWVRENGADAVLVYTFPWLIGKSLLELPPAGFLNFHFGKLPEYRGADAVFWEIRNREPLGAVTVHRMGAGLDTGPIAIRRPVPIHKDDTYGTHMENLASAGELVTAELLSMLEGDPLAIPWQDQDESLAKVWPKPGQRDVIIDWNQPAGDIAALVRACSPWNKGAYTFLGSDALRLAAVSESARSAGGKPPGTLIAREGGMLAACQNDQAVSIDRIYIDAGFFPGNQLAFLGILPGMRFGTPAGF